MKKCSCWEEKYRIAGWYDERTPILSNKPSTMTKSEAEAKFNIKIVGD